MKLVNFELSQPSFSIEFVGLGFVWDLHNSGMFLGITINPNDNMAVMRWKIGGNPETRYSACDLVFASLKLMIVSPRDEDLPYSEDLCVAGISKIIPEYRERPEYRTKREWNVDDPFHLVFEFQSRRSIEIVLKP